MRLRREPFPQVPLGRLGRLMKGYGGTRADAVDAGIPCIRYGDLYTYHKEFVVGAKSYLEPETAKNYFPLRHGDVVFAASGETLEDIGKSAEVLLEGEVRCGGDTIVFRPSHQFAPGFLGYALGSSQARSAKARMGRGYTVVHIYQSELRDLPVPTPPFEEQRRIAAFLDHETARIDELVREQERLIELLVEDLDAQVFSLLTDGASQGVQRSASGNPWFPEIPSHWTSSRLGWVVDSIQTGPFGSQLHAEDYVTSGMPLINPASIGPRGLIAENASRVDEVTLDRLKEYRLTSGDIVLGRRGQMGRCALVTDGQEGWLLGTGSMRIRPYRNVNAEFLTYYLGSRIARSYLELESVGTTMSNLNSEIVGRLPLPLPPISEQDAITTRLQAATRLVDESVDAAKSMVELLLERRSALISAAVTGQLDLRAVQPPEPVAGVA